MNYNKEGLDDFLEKVSEVKEQIQEISKGNFDEKKYTRLVNKLEETKENKDVNVVKEEEQIDRGREGKGEKDNYSHFCLYCNLEYVTPRLNCFKCNRETVTSKQRISDITVKVEEFKKKRMRREERKKRWDLWKKSKQMCKKINLIDYDKWNHFTDSEDSDEEQLKKQETLPTNDPTFKAMERDINERQERIKKNRKEAAGLKQKGNECFKKRDYLNAIEMYTKALELDKSNKALWLNRALVHNKLERYKEAIDDCSSVIEYCEVLEEGFEKSKDWALKAFLRRAFAYKQSEMYKEAREDCETAFKVLNGKSDEEFNTLYEEIKKLEEKVVQLTELNKNLEKLSEPEKMALDGYLKAKSIKDMPFEELFKYLKANKDFELILFGGRQYIRQLKTLMTFDSFYVQKQEKETDNPFDFLNNLNFIYLIQMAMENQNPLYHELFIEFNIIHRLVNFLVRAEKEKLFITQNLCLMNEQISCLVEGSLNKTIRKYLLKKSEALYRIFEIVMAKANEKDKKDKEDSTLVKLLLVKVFKLFNNLFYREEEDSYAPIFKTRFYEMYGKTLFTKLIDTQTRYKRLNTDIIESIYSLD